MYGHHTAHQKTSHTIRVKQLVVDEKVGIFTPVFPIGSVITGLLYYYPYHEGLRADANFWSEENELKLIKKDLLTNRIHRLIFPVAGMVTIQVANERIEEIIIFYDK